MKERLFVKLSGVVLACGVIAGCASQSNNVATTPEAFNKSLADADTVAKAGDQDKAMMLYQQLAKSDPTREEPWSRMAQIQFTQGHYGQAIVDAQEALQRDQTDRQAKSVLAVSGLRVATQSLGELRQDASLAGDAKTDAQALAKELRDTLGEATLFPPDDSDKPVVKKKYVRRVAKKPDAASGSAATTAAAPAAPATPALSAPAPAAPAAPARAAQSSGASDPFSALR
jgi:tetratricopeptide (TPR) repeat protein